MTVSQLERRVEKLEKQVHQMIGEPPTSAKSWLASAGQFANDPLFDEIVRLGREYRQSLRPRKKRGRHGRVRH